MSVRSHVAPLWGGIALTLAAWASLALAAETYQYDALDRLTDIVYTNGGSLHYTYDANGNVLSVVTSSATTAVNDTPHPIQFELGPTTPNPGSGPRSISFSIPVRGHVALLVFDVSGREVATLLDGDLDPGQHVLRFFTDSWGNGVYYYRLEMRGRVRSGRLVVLR